MALQPIAVYQDVDLRIEVAIDRAKLDKYYRNHLARHAVRKVLNGAAQATSKLGAGAFVFTVYPIRSGLRAK